MNRRKRLPIVLIVVGVMALVGCIPLPATRQFMTNGNLKPSWKIGRGEGNPIWLGHTTLKEAINFLCDHASGERNPPPVWLNLMYDEHSPQEILQSWRQIDDHHFAMPYDVRTSLWIWPLCGIGAGSSGQYVILETDKDNVVTDYKVVSEEDYQHAYDGKDKSLAWPRSVNRESK